MLVIGAGITELRWSKNQCRNSRNGGLSEWKAFFSMKKVPVFRPIEVNGSEWRPVGMAAWIVPWECRKIWGRGSRRSRRSRKTWLVRRRTGAMLSIYIEPDGEFSERTILYLIIFASTHAINLSDTWGGHFKPRPPPFGHAHLKILCEDVRAHALYRATKFQPARPSHLQVYSLEPTPLNFLQFGGYFATHILSTGLAPRDFIVGLDVLHKSTDFRLLTTNLSTW